MCLYLNNKVLDEDLCHKKSDEKPNAAKLRLRIVGIIPLHKGNKCHHLYEANYKGHRVLNLHILMKRYLNNTKVCGLNFQSHQLKAFGGDCKPICKVWLIACFLASHSHEKLTISYK